MRGISSKSGEENSRIGPFSYLGLIFKDAPMELFCRRIRGTGKALFDPNGFNIGEFSDTIMGKLTAVTTDFDASKG